MENHDSTKFRPNSAKNPPEFRQNSSGWKRVSAGVGKGWGGGGSLPPVVLPRRTTGIIGAWMASDLTALGISRSDYPAYRCVTGAP